MMRFTAFFAVIVLANATGLYSLGDLASYGLGDGSLSRQEIRSPDGIIRGTLTYIDGDGKIKSISYGGDNDAELQKAASTEAPMKAEKAEEEPQPESEDSSSEQDKQMKEENVEEATPENDENKTATATATAEDKAAAQPALPQQVPYTPEVAAARAAHFAARDQAVLLQQLAANQEQLEANQQLLLNQPQILEYPPLFREYYGAGKSLKNINPYYYL